MISSSRVIFETARLIVRSYTIDDFADFFRLHGDEEIMRYIRPIQTKEQSKDFFEKILTRYDEFPGQGRWGMISKEDNHFIGSFAVIPIEKSGRLQLGYALLKEEWGKGYASESVKGGIRYAFQELDLYEIAGITYPANTASQKVLLRNGFAFDKVFVEGNRELNLYICKRSGIIG